MNEGIYALLPRRHARYETPPNPRANLVIFRWIGGCS